MADSKKFENLRFQKMEGRSTIERAFEIVKQFIIKKQRLLCGGMSIDYSLQLRGSKLYAADTLPDYDFLSPTNDVDSFELGRALCAAGITGVDVIGATHVTTQRVRVDGTVVADITYTPRVVYDTMFKLAFGGFNVLHPWYTMLDQFTALAMPFENPPMEVIIQRWEKDIKRLHMLLEPYPLEKPMTVPTMLHAVRRPAGNCILQGWGALAFYNHEMKWPVEKGLTVWGDECKIPQTFIPVFTDDFEMYLIDQKIQEPKFFNSMMGFPRHMETIDMHIYDTQGLKVGCVGNVASLPALMWYFMHRWLRYGDTIDQHGCHLVWEHMQTSRWRLTTETYGEHVWNLSFVHYIREFLNVPGERATRPGNLSFKAGCDVKEPTFDPKTSIYFEIDGAECERWVHPFSKGVLEPTKGVMPLAALPPSTPVESDDEPFVTDKKEIEGGDESPYIS